MAQSHSIPVDLIKANKLTLVGVVIALVAVNGFLATMIGFEDNYIAQDLTRIGTSAAALVLALIVVIKQGYSGLFGRSYLALAIGLVCWFSAECIWGYYEIVLAQESPFPSIADAIWLSSYGGIGYFLFSTSKFYGAGLKSWKKMMVGGMVAAFSLFYIVSLVTVSLDYVEDDWMPLLISVAYPMLDAIMLAMAFLMVFNGGRGKLTYIPWIFVSLILMGIADTLLGFAAMTGFEEDTSFITMVYNASYIWMAAGMFWHMRFMLSGEKLTFQ